MTPHAAIKAPHDRDRFVDFEEQPPSPRGVVMKISRTVAYALRATLQLAEQASERPVPCSRLAAEGNMPERFLLQILRSMVNKGILRSTRGVEGGYTLVKPPTELSLLEVIEAVDGPISGGDSLIELGFPETTQRNIQRTMDEVVEQMRVGLDSLKFSTLMVNGKPVDPDFDAAQHHNDLSLSPSPKKPR